MKRRAFIATLLAATAPIPALAQDRVRIVGCLLEGEAHPRLLSARLADLGYVEGKNLRFEVRRTREPATVEELDRAARQLADSGAEVLVAQGALPVKALHRATSRIPIVSAGVSNPVSLGLARSLRVPGSNVTGLSFGLEEAAVLQFGTLRAFRPEIKRMVFVLPLDTPDPSLVPEYANAAASAGIATDAMRAANADAVERLFASMRASSDAAWIGRLQPGLDVKQVAARAIRHRIATHGWSGGSVRDGLLFSHWMQHSDATRRMAAVIDKILRGADPATIPFELPDKAVLTINRATAAAIGVAIPEDLKLRATEIVG